MHRAVLLLALPVCCAAVQSPPLGRRTVGRYSDGRPIVMGSLAGASTQAYVEGFLVRTAGSAGVAVGLERPRESGTVRAAPRDPVLLSGKSVTDALDAIVDAEALLTPTGARRTHDRYRVTWAHGVAQVSAFAGRPTLLDTVVPAFRVKNLPLDSAVQRLVSQIAARPRPKPPDPTRNPIDPQMPDRLSSRKVVTVAMTRATARDILDALVVASGAASWVVRYGADPLDPHAAQFFLVSFAGQATQVD
jgi:hypothetical protein